MLSGSVLKQNPNQPACKKYKKKSLVSSLGDSELSKLSDIYFKKKLKFKIYLSKCEIFCSTLCPRSRLDESLRKKQITLSNESEEIMTQFDYI